MSQFLKEEKILMGQIWTIFVVVIGILAPQSNAESTSSISTSGFASSVLPSISTDNLSSIANVTTSTNVVINTDASSTVVHTVTSLPVQASSSTPAVSTNSSLKTKTSDILVLTTETFNYSTNVVLSGSQTINASQTSTKSALSTSSSNYSLNSSVESFLTPSVLLTTGPKSSNDIVSESRTTKALSPLSSSKGNQSTASVLGTRAPVNTTRLTSVVFPTVDPSGSASGTRTLPLTQTSAVNSSSVGLSSQSIAVTSVLPLETTHRVLLSSAAMATSRTLLTGFSSNSTKSMSTYATRSVVEGLSADSVSMTVVLTNTIAKSVSGAINETVSVSSLMSKSLEGMVNSSTPSVDVVVTTLSLSQVADSPTVTLSSDTPVLPNSSSVLNFTFQTPAVVSSVKLSVNRTSSSTVTSALLLPSSQELNRTVVSAMTTPAALPSTAATVNPSFAGLGSGSSIATNDTGEIPRTSSSSLAVSPYLTTSQNATSQSLSSVHSNTSSKATPARTVDSGVLSSAVANGTSRSFSVLPTVVASHNVTQPPSTVYEGILSSTAITNETSRPFSVLPTLVASQNVTRLPSTVYEGILSSTAVPMESSRPLSVLPSLVTSKNITSQSLKTSSVSSATSPMQTTVVTPLSSVSVAIEAPSSVPVVPSSLSGVPTLSLPSVSTPVLPNKTSSGDGLIVLSSSYPCYIYYVVEKTVFPAASANQTFIPATVPKMTVNIGSATDMPSLTPTVTLTYPGTMTNQVSVLHSQLESTSIASFSSEGVLTSSNVLPMSSSPKSSIKSTLVPSQPPLLPSATLAQVFSTVSDKVAPTGSSRGSLISSSLSISSLPNSSSSTVNTVKEASLLTRLQPSSSHQQTSTLASAFVFYSASESRRSSITDRTLSSPAATSASSSTTATPNISQTLSIGSVTLSNSSTTVVVHSSSGDSSIEMTSSVQDVVPTVSSSFNLSSRGLTFAPTSIISSKMKSSGTTTTIQASETSVFQTIAATSESPKPNILPNRTLFNKRIETSSEGLIVTTSSKSVAQLRNSSATVASSFTVSSNTLLANASTAVTSSTVQATYDLSMASTDSYTPQVDSFSSSYMVTTRSSFGVSVETPLSNSSNTERMSGVETSTNVKVTLTSTETNSVQVTSITSGQLSPEVALTSAETHSPQVTPITSGQLSPSSTSSSLNVSQVGAVSTSVFRVSQVVASSFTTPSSASTTGELPSLVSSLSTAVPHTSVISSPITSGLEVSTRSQLSSASNHSSFTIIDVQPSSSSLQASPTASSRQDGASSTPTSNSLRRTLSSSVQTNNLSSSIINREPSSSAAFSSLPEARRRRKKRAVGETSSPQVISSKSTAVLPSTSVISQTNSVSKIQALSQQTASSSQQPLSQTAVLSSSQGSSSFANTASTSFSGALTTGAGTSRGNSPSHSAVSSNGTAQSILKSSGTVSSVASNTSTVSIVQTVSEMPSIKSSTMLSISSSTSLFVTSSPEQTPSASVGTSSAEVGNETSSSIVLSDVVKSSALLLSYNSSTSELILSSHKPIPSPGATTSSIAVGSKTSPPLSSQVSTTSSFEVPRKNSTAVQSASSLPTFVTSSSAVAVNGTLSSKSLTTSSAVVLGNSSSVVVHTAAYLSSLQQDVTSAITPSTLIGNDTLPLTSSVALTTSSGLFISSTSHVVGMSSEQSSSTVAVNGSTSSLVLMRSSVPMGSRNTTEAPDLKHSSFVFPNASATASSSRLGQEASSTLKVDVPSSVNESTSSVVLMTSSVPMGSRNTTVATDMKETSTVFANASETATSSRLLRETSSTFKVDVPSSVNGSTSSVVLLSSSLLMGSSTTTASPDMKRSSGSFANASATVSSSRLLLETRSTVKVVVASASPASMGRNESSLTKNARQSSLTIIASPLPTKTANVTLSTSSLSPQASHVIVSATLQSFIAPTSKLLSSLRTDHASQTLQQTIPTSSATTSSSTNSYKPPLVTISSLGICWVVYTTRLVQPTLIPTPQVNVSSSGSVNVNSTLSFSLFTPLVNATSVAQVFPTETLNTSSPTLLSTLTVNASSSQSSAVNSSLRPTEVSSIYLVLSTLPVPDINSTVLSSSSMQVAKSSNLFQSTVASAASTTTKSATASTLVTSTPVSTPLLSTVPPTSITGQAVSPTPTFIREVSSSVTVPTTQPPDPSRLLFAIFEVGPNTVTETNQFKIELESDLATAYAFAVLPLKRRRRAVGDVNATIQSIQRNRNNINVTFFVSKNNQPILATEAAQNFNKLSKDQLKHFVNLDVITPPQPLVQQPTTSVPLNGLASLIIKNSADNNISIPANKETLEKNLASYYRDQKPRSASTIVTATIATILHEPNEKVYLEFYVLVDGNVVNRTIVVETFKVSNVNLLTAKLGFQVLVPVYIPDSLANSETDQVIIGISVGENQDLTNSSFRSDLANKLVALYVEAKGRKTSRRKRRSGSTSATILDVVRKSESANSEADATFFVFDAGSVVNGSYVASVMNRLSTGEMTTFTRPYAVLTAPKPVVVPTTPTEVIPTVASTPIKWWIIPAVLGPILLIVVIILLICWRWKKGAPKAKVEPDTIRMLETNRRRDPPVHGFDVARHTEPGVSSMKTTSFMSGTARDEEEETEKSTLRTRETSLRRKVGKPPVQKLPTREQKLTNVAYEEDEEEENESVASVTPTGSTASLIGTKRRKPPSVIKSTPIPPQRSSESQTRQEQQRAQELSEDESEEESEDSGEETETEPESVAPPPQAKHSAAQVPTVAVMSEATGPPRYPPVRFRSSVHPAPSLPPLNPKQTSLVGGRVEVPSEDDAPRGRKRGKGTRRELEQRADLERQKNKQRLRERRRDSEISAVPPERRAWDRAQHDFDDVLGEEDTAERVITGKKAKHRRRRPPSSSVATDEEGMPHLKSYRKLKSPKTSSNASTRDRGKKSGKSADSVSNASSDESEIDMNETRRRMHAMLDNAFALLGPQSAKKPPTMDLEEMSPQPQGYPIPPQRPPVVPRYIGGQPALPEPPPAHGRATEPTPGQRRRVQPPMPGYPVGMPHTPIGMPGYPVRPPVRPVVTRDPIVVWDPADRQRMLNQRAPPPTYAYKDPSGQNLYITPVHQQRDEMGGLVWSPYAAEDTMDALYPDLAQASYPGALGTTPPKDTSFLSQLQAAPPHDTILNMSANSTLDQRGATLGQSPQPLIKSIKDELFRLSQGAQRKTPITEL